MPLRRGHELIIEDLVPSEQKRLVPFILPHGNCAIYVYPGAVQSVNRETSTQSWARGTSVLMHGVLHAIQGFMHMLIFHKQM